MKALPKLIRNLIVSSISALITRLITKWKKLSKSSIQTGAINKRKPTSAVITTLAPLWFLETIFTKCFWDRISQNPELLFSANLSLPTYNQEKPLNHKKYERSFSKHQSLDWSIDHWHVPFLCIVSHFFQCVLFLWLDLLISWVDIFFHLQIFFKVQSFIFDFLGQVLFLLEKWTLCQLMSPSHLLHVFQSLLTQFIGYQFDRKLVVSSVMDTKIDYFPSGYVSDVGQCFFFVSFGVDFECSHVDFFWK